MSNPTSIKIVKLNGFPPEVEYSLLIKDDFHVEVYWRHMNVLTRDLINGFSSTVTKYPQINKIVDRLKSTPLNVPCELRSVHVIVLDLEDELQSADLQMRLQITFTGKQLLSFGCNRYSKDDMADAINLYLRSRNSYRALREILFLPSHNTVCGYFGKHGQAGGALECERTIKNVFSSLNDGQKDCFLSLDEIHVKPGLQYHVLRNAQNTREPIPAKTILAVMINSSFGI